MSAADTPYVLPWVPRFATEDRDDRDGGTGLLDRPEWWDYAECLGADPDLFFSRDNREQRYARAKYCDVCEAREECLETALANGERFGVWGGFTEGERDRARRKRKPLERFGREPRTRERRAAP